MPAPHDRKSLQFNTSPATCRIRLSGATVTGEHRIGGAAPYKAVVHELSLLVSGERDVDLVCEAVELLSPQQERLLADAAATVPAPFREDFLKDAKNHLGNMPTNHAVMAAQRVARLASGAPAFGGAMNPQLDDDDSPLDANGLLKDGRTYRVRMHARDSVQGAIAASRQRIHDGTDNPFGLNRPGYRYNDSIDRSEASQAYQTRVLDGQERWRAGPGGGLQDASALGTE
jgi:hypothetical protein